MAGHICNYVYQIVMGRMLTEEDYGTLNALFALLTIASVPGLAIALVVSKYIAGYNATGEQFKIGLFLRKMLFYVSIFTAVVIALGLVFAQLISSYLMVDNIFHVVLIITSIALTLLLPISTGAVQGLKWFWDLGLLNLVTPVARLLLGILLVYLGFRLDGALGALAAGNLLAVLIGFIILRDKFKVFGPNIALGRREAIGYAMPVLIVTFCISVLTNIDMLMIKHYFSPQESGLYGAAVIFGRAIYYFPMAITMAMFPLAAEAKALKTDAYGSLKKALLYSAVLCGLGVLALNLFPEIIINLLFGDRYLPAVHYIRLVSLAMFPLCLLSIIANFNLAINKVKLTIWSLAIGSIAEYFLILKYHATISQVLYVLMGVGLVLLIANFSGTMLRKPDREMEKVYSGM